jgi:hypothetical protein
LVNGGFGLVLLIGACGGEPSTPGDTQTPTTSGAASFSTTAPPEPASSTSEPVANGDCSLETPSSCGGNAVLTIGGDTVEFDFFACFYGDDAVAAVGDGIPDWTFAALGQVEQAGGTASVVINVKFSDELAVETVVFVPAGDQDRSWFSDDEDTFSHEGDRITWDGEFVEVVGGADVTGERAAGSLDATCA